MLDAEIIDPRALARLEEWGGPRLLTQMIRLFLENAPQRVEQVRKGLEEGSLKDAERGVHSLKSSAANVGAVRLSRVAAEMEEAALSGDAEAVAGQLSRLEAELVSARDLLAARLANAGETE